MTTSRSTSALARLFRAIGRHPIRSLLAVLAVVVLLLASGVLVLFYSEPGRALVTRTLEEMLSRPGEMELEIGELSGPLPGRIAIDRITVADADGTWLQVRSLEIRWAPLDLLSARLRVEAVRAEELELLRKPSTPERDEPPSEGGVPELPPIEIELESLAIQRLRLGEAVLGEAASLKLEASGAALRNRAAALLELERIDERRGGARARLAWDAVKGSLDLDARLSEPAGGLVARLLDLPEEPPIELAVDGEGPAGNWRGKLDLEAGSLLSLDSSLQISVGPAFRLAMDGEAEPGEALGGAIAAVLGPRTDFAIELHRPAESSDWSVTLRELASAAVEAKGSATISPAKERIDGSLKIVSTDGQRLATLIAPVRFGSGSVKIAFQGPLAYPAIDLDGAVESLAAEDYSADRATFDVELRPSGPIAAGARLEAKGQANLDRARTPWPEANAMIGDQLTVDVQDASLERNERLEIGRLEISADNAEASLAGNATLPGGAVNASGTVVLGDLSTFSEGAGRNIAGSASAEFDLSRQESGELDLSVNGALREAGLEQPVVERLLGPSTDFGFKLQMGSGGPLEISDIKVKGSGAEVAGNLSFDLAANRLEAAYDGVVSDLQALELAGSRSRAGRLTVSGTLSGPVSSLKLNGDLRLSGADVAGLAVDNVKVDYEVSDLTEKPNGEIGLVGLADPLPEITARTRFELAGDRIQLSGLNLSSPATAVQGSLAISLENQIASGEFRVESKNIAPWSRLAGADMAGALNGRVRLSGQGARQDVALDLTASDFRLNGDLSIQQADLDMRIDDVTDISRLDGTLAARNARAGPVDLAQINLTLNGPLRDLAYALRASGAVGERNLALDAQGGFSATVEGTVLAVNSLSGQAADVPVRLRNAVSIQLAPEIRTGNIELTVGDGTVAGMYSQSGGKVSMRADAKSVPLASVWLAAPPQLEKSVIDATASLSGPLGGPSAKLDLQVTGVAAGETEEVAGGLTLDLAAALGEGELTANGRVEGLAGVTSQLQIAVPASLSLAPAGLSIDQNRPLTGNVTYDGPVKPAWALLGLGRHRLEGQGDIAVDIAGTPAEPRLSGRVEISEGRYENLDTGTILTRMRVVARPSGTALSIEEATARDGNGGEISLDGEVAFGGADLLSVDLEASFAKARLVRRDELTASVSGRVALRGNQSRQKVSGNLEVEQAEVRLLGGGRPDVVEIRVEEQGTPPAGAVGAPPRKKPSKAELDLTVSMPGRVFVRGRGLDSEWGGNLSIKGTATTPRVEGELHPIRGQYEFAGKVFHLREGSIQFGGEEEINPALDLSAELTTDEMTAIIRITGTAKQPKIDLESIPDYPKDEILSRVLFNKSTGRLSAGEAVQLAQALRRLTASGGGGGILDFARGMLNLDVLRFQGGEETGGGGAEAGKYINDRVYLGVEGNAAGQTGVTVEVEITPQLKLESDIGSDDKSQTGLKWKKDY